MIAFKRPQLEDQSWIAPIFRASGQRSCEYTFTNLYTWAEAYDEKVALVEGFLVIRTESDGGSYSWGIGSGDRRRLMEALYQDSLERGVPFILWGMNREQCGELEEMYPGKFLFEDYRDGSDYCYSIDKLCTLAGKKLHAKRNHIHRFEENFPGWHTEPVTVENLPQCIRLAKDWEKEEAEAGLEDWESREGENALYLSVQHYEELGLEGLILFADESCDRPLAFTIGTLISGDTYDVLFEKAYGEVQGAYPMINREFSRWVKEHYPQVAYMNREDDLGEPNLRKAKLSYHPDLMVEKWLVTLKEGEAL